MRCVIDANVVVAGLRSPQGASAALLRKALEGEVTLLLSVALAFEYEAVCALPEQRIVSGLRAEEVGTVIAALCAVAEPVVNHFLWRPQLRDPADEMVLETAISAQADALVTFNRRDFGDVPRRFGMALLAPQQALERIRG